MGLATVCPTAGRAAGAGEMEPAEAGVTGERRHEALVYEGSRNIVVEDARVERPTNVL
jgi:hypothetical protein